METYISSHLMASTILCEVAVQMQSLLIMLMQNEKRAYMRKYVRQYGKKNTVKIAVSMRWNKY